MERDNSHEAIMRRYRIANEYAIYTVNSVCFDSLRDVFFLLEENRKLKEELEGLKNAQN